jgi:hypothetical protein
MSNQYDMTVRERWEAEQRKADALDPWRDQTKILTRDAAGNLVQIARPHPTPGPIADDAWDRMSYAERMNYAANASRK